MTLFFKKPRLTKCKTCSFLPGFTCLSSPQKLLVSPVFPCLKSCWFSLSFPASKAAGYLSCFAKKSRYFSGFLRPFLPKNADSWFSVLPFSTKHSVFLSLVNSSLWKVSVLSKLILLDSSLKTSHISHALTKVLWLSASLWGAMSWAALFVTVCKVLNLLLRAIRSSEIRSPVSKPLPHQSMRFYTN